MRSVVVALALSLLSACTNPLGIRPAPELLDAIDFEFTRVLPGGNADLAGLQDGASGRHIRYGAQKIPVDGDIIVAFDGKRVIGIAELFSPLESTRPNDLVTLTIIRNGKRHEVTLNLSNRPE